MDGIDVFLISKVRNAPPELISEIRRYIENEESKGIKVYWPYRDNPYQKTDRCGLKIIGHNLQKLIEAKEVRIWYSPDSVGSIADLQSVMLLDMLSGKKITLVNREAVPRTKDKSYENVMLALHDLQKIKDAETAINPTPPS